MTATLLLSAFATYAAGFLVRPFGALVFGRIGDLVGRKYTFLVTITIMGLSTFLVGLLPGSASWGIAAPIILVGLRMLQGLALGGEYGGAATYVAEHAPDDRRGFYTSWIQTTATLGLFLSLIIILAVQNSLSKEDFAAWGWRIPFLLSAILLAISVWIRLTLSESPAFIRMKEEEWLTFVPRDTSAALELGYTAGNLHWRVRFTSAGLSVAREGPEHTYLDRVRPLLSSGRIRKVTDDQPS